MVDTISVLFVLDVVFPVCVRLRTIISEGWKQLEDIKQLQTVSISQKGVLFVWE